MSEEDAMAAFVENKARVLSMRKDPKNPNVQYTEDALLSMLTRHRDEWMPSYVGNYSAKAERLQLLWAEQEAATEEALLTKPTIPEEAAIAQQALTDKLNADLNAPQDAQQEAPAVQEATQEDIQKAPLDAPALQQPRPPQARPIVPDGSIQGIEARPEPFFGKNIPQPIVQPTTVELSSPGAGNVNKKLAKGDPAAVAPKLSQGFPRLDAALMPAKNLAEAGSNIWEAIHGVPVVGAPIRTVSSTMLRTAEGLAKLSAGVLKTFGVDEALLKSSSVIGRAVGEAIRATAQGIHPLTSRILYPIVKDTGTEHLIAGLTDLGVAVWTGNQALGAIKSVSKSLPSSTMLFVDKVVDKLAAKNPFVAELTANLMNFTGTWTVGTVMSGQAIAPKTPPSNQELMKAFHALPQAEKEKALKDMRSSVANSIPEDWQLMSKDQVEELWENVKVFALFDTMLTVGGYLFKNVPTTGEFVKRRFSALPPEFRNELTRIYEVPEAPRESPWNTFIAEEKITFEGALKDNLDNILGAAGSETPEEVIETIVNNIQPAKPVAPQIGKTPIEYPVGFVPGTIGPIQGHWYHLSIDKTLNPKTLFGEGQGAVNPAILEFKNDPMLAKGIQKIGDSAYRGHIPSLITHILNDTTALIAHMTDFFVTGLEANAATRVALMTQRIESIENAFERLVNTPVIPTVTAERLRAGKVMLDAYEGLQKQFGYLDSFINTLHPVIQIARDPVLTALHPQWRSSVLDTYVGAVSRFDKGAVPSPVYFNVRTGKPVKIMDPELLKRMEELELPKPLPQADGSMYYDKDPNMVLAVSNWGLMRVPLAKYELAESVRKLNLNVKIGEALGIPGTFPQRPGSTSSTEAIRGLMGEGTADAITEVFGGDVTRLSKLTKETGGTSAGTAYPPDVMTLAQSDAAIHEVTHIFNYQFLTTPLIRDFVQELQGMLTTGNLKKLGQDVGVPTLGQWYRNSPIEAFAYIIENITNSMPAVTSRRLNSTPGIPISLPEGLQKIVDYMFQTMKSNMPLVSYENFGAAIKMFDRQYAAVPDEFLARSRTLGLAIQNPLKVSDETLLAMSKEQDWDDLIKAMFNIQPQVSDKTPRLHGFIQDRILNRLEAIKEGRTWVAEGKSSKELLYNYWLASAVGIAVGANSLHLIPDLSKEDQLTYKKWAYSIIAYGILGPYVSLSVLGRMKYFGRRESLEAARRTVFNTLDQISEVAQSEITRLRANPTPTSPMEIAQRTKVIVRIKSVAANLVELSDAAAKKLERMGAALLRKNSMFQAPEAGTGVGKIEGDLLALDFMNTGTTEGLVRSPYSYVDVDAYRSQKAVSAQRLAADLNSQGAAVGMLDQVARSLNAETGAPVSALKAQMTGKTAEETAYKVLHSKLTLDEFNRAHDVLRNLPPTASREAQEIAAMNANVTAGELLNLPQVVTDAYRNTPLFKGWTDHMIKAFGIIAKKGKREHFLHMAPMLKFSNTFEGLMSTMYAGILTSVSPLANAGFNNLFRVIKQPIEMGAVATKNSIYNFFGFRNPSPMDVTVGDAVEAFLSPIRNINSIFSMGYEAYSTGIPTHIERLTGVRAADVDMFNKVLQVPPGKLKNPLSPMAPGETLRQVMGDNVHSIMTSALRIPGVAMTLFPRGLVALDSMSRGAYIEMMTAQRASAQMREMLAQRAIPAGSDLNIVFRELQRAAKTDGPFMKALLDDIAQGTLTKAQFQNTWSGNIANAMMKASKFPLFPLIEAFPKAALNSLAEAADHLGGPFWYRPFRRGNAKKLTHQEVEMYTGRMASGLAFLSAGFALEDYLELPSLGSISTEDARGGIVSPYLKIAGKAIALTTLMGPGGALVFALGARLRHVVALASGPNKDNLTPQQIMSTMAVALMSAGAEFTHDQNLVRTMGEIAAAGPDPDKLLAVLGKHVGKIPGSMIPRLWTDYNNMGKPKWNQDNWQKMQDIIPESLRTDPNSTEDLVAVLPWIKKILYSRAPKMDLFGNIIGNTDFLIRAGPGKSLKDGLQSYLYEELAREGIETWSFEASRDKVLNTYSLNEVGMEDLRLVKTQAIAKALTQLTNYKMLRSPEYNKHTVNSAERKAWIRTEVLYPAMEAGERAIRSDPRVVALTRMHAQLKRIPEVDPLAIERGARDTNPQRQQLLDKMQSIHSGGSK